MARGTREDLRTRRGRGGVSARHALPALVLLLLGGGAAQAASFYTVTPCRLLDTRLAAGPHGGPALASGALRAIGVGARCGVSSRAVAVATNVTVTGGTSAGNVSLLPLGIPAPTSIVNFSRLQTRANNAVIPLGPTGAVEMRAATHVAGEVHVIVDVFGYFADAAAEASTVAPPAFSPPPGAYEGVQTVELLTSTPGASIRYTLDGSSPSSTTGTLYTGPVNLTASVTLRAIAYKSGLANSPLAVGAYDLTLEPVLLAAQLVPQSGAISLGSGRATLLLAADEQTGEYRSSWTNLTGALTAAHIHAPDGSILFDIDTAAPAADGSRTWNVVNAGIWTRPQILAALRAGQCYVNLHTGAYPNGEIKGFLRIVEGSTTFTPPPPPPPLPGGPISEADAARFLMQATYGPRPEDVAAVQQLGYDGWISQQITRPLTSHWNYINALPGEIDELPNEHTRESIWKQAIQGNDQLRQRVVLALTELLVVSDRDDDLGGAEGIAIYADLLGRHAFGSYRDLLQEVTLLPAMGVYLDMLGSDKEDEETGRKPNENFPRELLQLFSVGLYQLHPDGTLKVDETGLPIPTYDQEVVEGFARVFTGWTFAGQDRSRPWRFYWPEPDWRRPMELWSDHHSTGNKTLLDGVVVNAPAAQELSAAIDNIFAHPNVGPFVCRHLIQRLVTSNPSPAYVYRCGTTFANNGYGVRGDLGAVVRAILLDWEARAPAARDQSGYGKVREPVVRFVHLLRTLRAQPPADGRFRYYWGGGADWGLNQQPISSPTVFNFFDPNYSQPGPIANAGLVSPELQITNETSVFGTANYLRWILRGNADDDTDVTLDWSYLTSAPNDTVLLDRVNLLFYGGGMTAGTRDILARALAGPNFTWTNDPIDRALTLVWLVALSPDFVTVH
jgi:uncharacterized protein (DUF1800 family)